jgi:hypothetical protein
LLLCAHFTRGTREKLHQLTIQSFIITVSCAHYDGTVDLLVFVVLGGDYYTFVISKTSVLQYRQVPISLHMAAGVVRRVGYKGQLTNFVISEAGSANTLLLSALYHA